MRILFVFVFILGLNLSSVSCYDQYMGQAMAFMSQFAYKSNISINQWNCYGCKHFTMESVQSFNIKDNEFQGFVGYFVPLKVVVVSFRGSKLEKNLKNILNIPLKNYKNCTKCNVGSGFQSAYNKTRQPMKQVLQRILKKYNSVPIVFTGHSLGGVLAVLSALDMKSTLNIDRAISVYTYGQPRIGNDKFADYMNNMIPQTYRIVYNCDIVPTITKKFFINGHGGKQIWFSKDHQGKYTQCQYQCQKYKLCLPSIQDHQMTYYTGISDPIQLNKYLTSKMDEVNKKHKI